MLHPLVLQLPLALQHRRVVLVRPARPARPVRLAQHSTKVVLDPGFCLVRQAMLHTGHLLPPSEASPLPPSEASPLLDRLLRRLQPLQLVSRRVLKFPGMGHRRGALKQSQSATLTARMTRRAIPAAIAPGAMDTGCTCRMLFRVSSSGRSYPTIFVA